MKPPAARKGVRDTEKTNGARTRPRHGPANQSQSVPPRGGTHTRVRCCQCSGRFLVPPQAPATQCPFCLTTQGVAPLSLSGRHALAQLRTAGSITIEPDAHVTASRISAGGCLRVLGRLDADVVAHTLHVGPRGAITGAVRARSINVEPGGSLG